MRFGFQFFFLTLIVVGCRTKEISKNTTNTDEKIKLIVDHDPSGTGAANLFVNVSINERLVQMFLDTGAAGTSVENNNFTKELPKIGEKSSSGVFSDNRKADLVSISELRLGSIIRRDFQASRAKGKSKGSNLLGMNFFKDLRLHFVFSMDNIEIVTSPASQTVCESEQKLELGKRGHIYMDVEWPDGTKAKALWDSGMAMTLVSKEFYLKNLEKFSKLIGQIEMTDSKQKDAQLSLYRMNGPKVGNQSLGSSVISIANLDTINQDAEQNIDVVLGYTTFSQADWYFDFPGKRWCLWQAGTF